MSDFHDIRHPLCHYHYWSALIVVGCSYLIFTFIMDDSVSYTSVLTENTKQKNDYVVYHIVIYLSSWYALDACTTILYGPSVSVIPITNALFSFDLLGFGMQVLIQLLSVPYASNYMFHVRYLTLFY